jgi:CHAT domain-containing protein
MTTLAAMQYADLDVVVESTPTGFVARVESDAGGQAEAEFMPPFSPQELEIFLLRLTRPRRISRRIESTQMGAVKSFGQSLFDTLFAGELRACLRASYEDAARRGMGLRIRIHPVSAPELADVPWEFLYHANLNRFLALSTETPVVRYLDLPEAVRPLSVTSPIRILVAIAGPIDLIELDVEAEWRRLRDALGDLETRGAVTLERLDNASMGDLQRSFRQDEYHVLHFVGHGGFDERVQDGVLMMEDAERRGVSVSAQRLGTLLHDHRSLRLVVLNACEGARTDVADPFAGVAQTLVQQGLAAVVAMQFEVSDAAAIVLAHEFYGALADGYPVEAALAEARKAVFNAGNDTEWATPVLYLRASDGRLFDLKPAIAAGPDVVHAPIQPTREEALPLASTRESEPEPKPEVPLRSPPDAVERPVVPARRRAVVLGFASTVGLVGGFLLPLYTDDARGTAYWYQFVQVLERFGGFFTSLELIALIVGTCVATLLALNPRRTPLSAGLLFGFGAAGVIKGACTLWWIPRYGSPRPGAYLLLLAPALAMAAGLDLVSATKRIHERVPGRTLATAMIAAVLVGAGAVIPYRGTDQGTATVLHRWNELAYEPVAVALFALAVAIVARRTGHRVFAGGVLIALGVTSFFYWAWPAGFPTVQFIRGEAGGVHPLYGGYLGAIGGLLLASAGLRHSSPVRSRSASD